MVETKQHTPEQPKEIKREIKECLRTNENRNAIYQNLWAPAKAVLREHFTVINACVKESEGLCW